MRKVIYTLISVVLLLSLLFPVPFAIESNSSDWWDTDWYYCKLITIDNNQVEASLTNFPIFVYIEADSDLASHAQSDGDDIVFVSYDNKTKYSHEIESYYDGNLSAWVKIPNLNANSDTLMWLYYGNPDCNSQQNIAGTWDSNYVLVHHLSESSGDFVDSSRSGYNGEWVDIDHDSTRNADGIAAGCVDFNGDNDKIIIKSNDGGLSGYSSVTVSAWITQPSQGDINEDCIFDGWNNGNCFLLRYDSLSNQIDWIINVGGTKILSNSVNIENDGWRHVVGSYDGSNYYTYLNGSRLANTGQASGKFPNANTWRHIGGVNTSDFYTGKIDEVRVSKIARSSSWINTSYNTLSNPDTFIRIGNEKTYLGDTVPPNIEITTPKEGYLYINIFYKQYRIAFNPPVFTLIFGKINIETNVSDNVGINWVKFYIDDSLKETVIHYPFNWMWNEVNVIFPYTIKVIASDLSGNEDSDEIKVWKFQLF